jgi:predicted nucleotidyltransferase
MSGFEEYCDSNIFGVTHSTMINASVLGKDIDFATYGTIRAYWPFKAVSVGTDYTS